MNDRELLPTVTEIIDGPGSPRRPNPPRTGGPPLKERCSSTAI